MKSGLDPLAGHDCERVNDELNLDGLCIAMELILLYKLTAVFGKYKDHDWKIYKDAQNR